MSALLSIRDLSIAFTSGAGLSPGVKNIDFQVDRGEIVALVGESGSGKSITALSILQLLASPPARYLSGQIHFTDRAGRQIDLLTADASRMQSIRGNEIGMIFQEPMTSLNPVFTCGDQVAEAIRAHQPISRSAAREKSLALFEKVRLPDPAGLFDKYPHELSGGQKQRVMIAMAMSNHPSLLICDEPTTALDVTVQKTILELIRELQQTENMGVIFITHDLGVVAEIADRALVLYKGEVVEEGSTAELFRHPRHPYTKGLLNCRPVLHTKGERLPVVSDFMGSSPAPPISRGPDTRADPDGSVPCSPANPDQSAPCSLANPAQSVPGARANPDQPVPGPRPNPDEPDRGLAGTPGRRRSPEGLVSLPQGSFWEGPALYKGRG